MKTHYRILMDREMSRYSKGKQACKILEIGSRGLRYRKMFRDCDYLTTNIARMPGVDEVANANNLPFGERSFDIVICLNVLEHLPDPGLAVSEIRRVLKRGGETAIATPFLFPIHDSPADYWRFTEFGLRQLLNEFRTVTVKPLTLFGLRRFAAGYFVVAVK